MRSADRIGVGIGQTRGLSLHAGVPPEWEFISTRPSRGRIISLKPSTCIYKNGRPARVVMTDAGLNDYINDISFLPGFEFKRGNRPPILGLRRGLLRDRVSGCRPRRASCRHRASCHRQVSCHRQAFYHHRRAF